MDIPYYKNFISEAHLPELLAGTEELKSVPGFRVKKGLRQQFAQLETDAALRFVSEVYAKVRAELSQVLERRVEMRRFVDATTKRLVRETGYNGIIGQRTPAGEIALGPVPKDPDEWKVAPLPDYIAGFHLTLFGPADTEKMAINAMNAWHRKPADEPEVVTRLVEGSPLRPMWGADDEDSKTPDSEGFIKACANINGCFDGSLQVPGYKLQKDRLAQPIKRIPGLALPDSGHFFDDSPLPLHLYDFALHFFHNCAHPERLVFYIPKLEDEGEALYVKHMIGAAEEFIGAYKPGYKPKSVRTILVFENARAVFRMEAMAKALLPYFAGGSLGWHDYLASAARFFRFDPGYRIPVKADPNIVINHIRESHDYLVRVLGPRGAVKIGGMYGVLPEAGHEVSYRVAMTGFIKDVVVQLKRGLDGFWVAHPDFVRIGIALVEAWGREDRSMEQLVGAIAGEDKEELLAFISGPDVPGLDEEDPGYPKALLAADLKESELIANSDPEEIRYNIFQSLQYMASWLQGTGCVALPALTQTSAGEPVFVRVMDDLATTERSRWEVWAEVYHGRVSREVVEGIIAEELAFIRKGEDSGLKKVQVAWDERWYPVAAGVLRELVFSPEPVEFVTELLLPHTF